MGGDREMKFRKLTGSHYRLEGMREVQYRPGDVIHVDSEGELTIHDPQLRTWERMPDDTPSKGSTGRLRTKEHFLFLMQQQSKILRPELMSLGTMYSGVEELYRRATTDVNKDGTPVGLLAQAKLALKEAISAWHYGNDTQPVEHRSNDMPQSEEINRLEATIEVLEAEIAHLEKVTHTERQMKTENMETSAENKKAQARTMAYHPAYRNDAEAKKVRAGLERTTSKVAKIKRGAAASC
jgi:hypothetical protein